MNKNIFILFALLLAFNFVYSQNKDNITYFSRYNLKRIPISSDEYQIKVLTQSLIKYYKDSFKYYREFKDSLYSIEKTNNGYNLIIFSDNKILDKIKVLKIIYNNPKNCTLVFNQLQINKLIDKTKLLAGKNFNLGVNNLQIISSAKGLKLYTRK